MPFDRVGRRNFITLLGGAAAASIYRPHAALSQPKVLGVLSQGSTSTHPTPSAVCHDVYA
jgi:hypothetical protein